MFLEERLLKSYVNIVFVVVGRFIITIRSLNVCFVASGGGGGSSVVVVVGVVCGGSAILIYVYAI